MSAKAIFAGFPPEAIKFLRDLKRNNNRDWFLAHKQIYDTHVKGEMIHLLAALAPEIRKFAPEITYDPVKAVFRIYRDIRFSSDKSPYKTNIAAALDPKLSSNAHPAGLYIHLDSQEVLIAGGLYHPEKAELMAVRSHIAKNHVAFRKLIGSTDFKKHFGKLDGSQLQRVPRGFPTDHAAADLLRYKDFLAYSTRPAAFAETSEFFPFVVRHFQSMMPLIRFLNTPLKAIPRRINAEME